MAGDSEYPKRPGHFAHKFCRLLAKATVANELGADVCWLLTVIAHTEDAKGYSGPVLYFNGQLMSFCGIKTEDKLARVRKKAVDAGWLHYVPGSRGVAARYWVTIPPAQRAKDDLPSDERAEKYDVVEPAKSESQYPAGAAVRAEFTRSSRGESAAVRAVDVRNSSSLNRNPNRNQEPPSPPPAAAEEKGPNPEEVAAEWNRHKGLVPVVGSDPGRDRNIRSRVFDPLWVKHWRAAIEFAASLPDGPNGWRPDLSWFLKEGKFTQVVEKMLAPPVAPAGNPGGKNQGSKEEMVAQAFRKAAELGAKRDAQTRKAG